MRFVASAEDLTRLRFAISPLWECVASLFAFRDETRAAMHAAWLRGQTPMRSDDLELLTSLVRPSGYIPDFLTPPPDESFPALEKELERLRATPGSVVRDELKKMWGSESHVPLAAQGLLRTPSAGLKKLSNALERHWRRNLEPHWGRMRALIEADLNERSKILALRGPEAMLGSLHANLKYENGIIERVNSTHQSVQLNGRGLLLVPSVFVTPKAMGIDWEPWQPTIFYPARGALSLWGEPVTNDQLEGLLGAQTARALTLLHAPRTTRDLALSLKLPQSGASYHVSRLRNAGLLESQRNGREVYHRRSSRGEALIELFG